MRPFLPLAPIVALVLAATPSHAEDLASPFEMCALLEARIAAGEGVTLPDADAELVRHAGTVDLARDNWPEAYQARAGQAICVAVSPFTGNYEFFDESGVCFFTVVPVLPTTDNWVAPFRHAEDGTFPDDDLYAPWRLVDVWFLSHAESAESAEDFGRDAPTARPHLHAEFESHAESAENAELDLDLRFVNNGGQLRFVNNPDVTNLCFTAFSFTETNLYFTAAWPTNEALPDATLDLYGSTNLALPLGWRFLSSHPATNPPLEFAVAHASLPWYVAPTQHVHDATCVSVTNVVASPLDGTTVYTNVFWSCATNRTPGEAGFFRLGTRQDTDADGFYDAAELLVHGTRPDRLDSDGDGVPDGVEPSVWWSNPLWATNAEDVDFVVDIVAPTDGSAETVLAMDGLRIPLSPAAGSWCFSLPPGQIVSCSASASGSFFVLWAGTPGGSFWDSPESFETPFWTSGNIAGYHEIGAFSDIAVPVLTVEPDFGGPFRSGPPVASTGSHLTGAGSVCVHGDEALQRYSWSVAPAALGFGRHPVVTGAVRLEDGCPVIDVAGTTGERTGTFGFGPGYDSSGGLLWGELSAPLAAHRCDATVSNPYCSVCGCYEPLDVALSLSKEVLTLKHDNQTMISVVHPYSGGESFSEGSILIRRVGESEWQTLGMESDLDPWTARIAGRFELRGVVSVGGIPVATPSRVVEVRFPTVEQIAADSIVVSAAGEAWTSNMTACTKIPNRRQEFGFAIRLNTTNDTYVCDPICEGPPVPPWEAGEVYVPIDPYNDPEEPAPTDPGAVYLVAGFHTHTSPVYFPEYFDDKPVGPSSGDLDVASKQHIPGIVMDYVATNEDDGTIRVGHPLDGATKFYFSTPPDRRPLQ